MILATEHGFPRWLLVGTVLRGWLSVEHGHVEHGIEQIRQGLAETSELEQQVAAALLAEAYGTAGHAEEGLNVVTEALTKARKIGLGFYESELHRLKGELLLGQAVPAVQDAEACFQKAIDLSRRQSAKSWELRAVRSLSRLWQKQGKKDEARRMLAEIYGWFTEGFDTADLKKAKAMIEELS